jgi:hypothetical protein
MERLCVVLQPIQANRCLHERKNWTLLSGLSAKQCKHELALAKNDGVVDIVETP